MTDHTPDRRPAADPTALDLDAIRPATDLLITQLRETVGEIKSHAHPSSGEDFYCLNLASWLGERMGPVLRRLGDEQAETKKWRERNTALADEFTAEVDRLRAELDRETRAHAQTVADRDHFEDMADRLAEAISTLTGADIGEHSSGNDPWMRALDAAEGAMPRPETTAPANTRTFAYPAEPTDITAVRDRTGQLWVCPGRPGDNLWWRGQLGHGVGYEWHQLLQAGPLTPADAEAVAR